MPAEPREFDIYVCTGCGKQVHETYEYKHADCPGPEVLTKVIPATDVERDLARLTSLQAGLRAEVERLREIAGVFANAKPSAVEHPLLPCPTCTTEKQGEAERPRRVRILSDEELAELYPDLDFGYIAKRTKELRACESDAEAIALVLAPQPSVVEARDKLVEELEAEAERDERMRELGNGGELEPHVAPGLRRAAQLVREQPSVVEGEQ